MISEADLAALIAGRTGRATVEDIYFCFRLILGRDPSPEERIGHFARVGEPLDEIVRSFVQSLEFERRNLLKPREGAVRLISFNDVSIFVDPDDIDVGRPAMAGEYEPHVHAVFNRYVRSGMVVVDVGANIGVFTLLAARLVGERGMVIAVEPNPLNVRMIEASRRANQFSQVEVHCVAAAEKAGILVLHQSGSNGTVAPPADDLDALLRSRIVPAIALDSIVPADWRVDFVKIDVERYELKALRGFESTLRRCRPMIVSEFSPTAMEPHEGRTYIQFLIGLGYKLSVIARDGSLEECGRDADCVMRAFTSSGVDHVDLFAEPII